MAFGTNSMKLGKDHVRTVCNTSAKITCEQCARRAPRNVSCATHREEAEILMASLLVGLLCFCLPFCSLWSKIGLN